MSIDFPILGYQDVVPVKTIGLANNIAWTLEVLGGPRKVIVEVRVNEEKATEFVVVSKQKMLVEIPKVLRNSRITSVIALRGLDSSSSKTLLTFNAALGGRVTSGFSRVLQNYLKVLLSRPGSDAFMPAVGGGLYELVGITMDESELKTKARVSVSSASAHVIEMQAGNSRIPLSEQLLKAELVAITLDQRSLTLDLSIKVTAGDGSTTRASLRL